MNDAHTRLTAIERVDWNYLGWVIAQMPPEMINDLERGVQWMGNPCQIRHTVTDPKRKVWQRFTVTLVETPIQDEPKEVL